MFLFVCATMAMLMGLRHEVGGDWVSYFPMFLDISELDLASVMELSDPGYKVLNWLVAQIGGDIYLVDLICATIMMVGVFRFCRSMPNPWLALLVFMAKVGTYQNARQAAPYYVLLFPPLLASAGHVWLTRRRWWQCLVLMVLLVTLAHQAFVHGRGFLSENMAMSLKEKYPHAKLLAVFGDYFTARASVETERNFLKNGLPAGEKKIGYATTVGQAEPGLWIPFGQRIVERVLPGDTLADLRQNGIRYIVVEDLTIQIQNLTIDQWNAQYNCKTVDIATFTRDPGSPPAHLYLVCLQE